jgi:DNA-binding LacI/PurR family transcriptional regulator
MPVIALRQCPPCATLSHMSRRTGVRSTVTLKSLAEYLGLSPATISIVINKAPSAKSIPEKTKVRILAAAKKLKYRPSFVARSLRTFRSFTVGVLVPEISEGYAALVMSGIEDYLLEQGYFYFVASHRHREDLLDEYPKMFIDRAVEGLIAVDTPIRQALGIPIVAVSGHQEGHGITNIVLNHKRGAMLVLEHLQALGHRQIAFIKGQAFSSDTQVRWNSLREAAATLGQDIDKRLVVQLEGDEPSPEPGFRATQRLLANKAPFTALVSFNDMSAIGAMRALRDSGLKIPEDVSVVGFDDIQGAAFQNPGLTTIRQPLRRMGEIAAEIMVQRISKTGTIRKRATVEPELILRQSTAAARPLHKTETV